MKSNWRGRFSRRSNQLQRLEGTTDITLFVRVFFFALAVPLIMRLPLSTIDRLLEPRHTFSEPDPNRYDRIVRCVEIAQQVGYPFINANCLTRGLTLYAFLRRAGMQVALDFGVSQLDGEFLAHCWLVHDDTPFLENADPHTVFVRVFRLPGLAQKPTVDDDNLQETANT